MKKIKDYFWKEGKSEAWEVKAKGGGRVNEGVRLGVSFPPLSQRMRTLGISWGELK